MIYVVLTLPDPDENDAKLTTSPVTTSSARQQAGTLNSASLHDTIKLHFFLAAMRCRAPIPVMTDNNNEKIVIAHAPPSSSSELWTWFHQLPLRLGNDWTMALVDREPKRHCLYFRRAEFHSPVEAYEYCLQNMPEFKFIDYETGIIGAKRDERMVISTVQLDDEILGGDGEAKCKICWEDVSLGTEVGQLRCKDWFHISCISDWFDRYCTCPYCQLDTRV
jgi:Ring finger domain